MGDAISKASVVDELEAITRKIIPSVLHGGPLAVEAISVREFSGHLHDSHRNDNRFEALNAGSTNNELTTMTMLVCLIAGLAAFAGIVHCVRQRLHSQKDKSLAGLLSIQGDESDSDDYLDPKNTERRASRQLSREWLIFIIL